MRETAHFAIDVINRRGGLMGKESDEDSTTRSRPSVLHSISDVQAGCKGDAALPSRRIYIGQPRGDPPDTGPSRRMYFYK